MHLNRLEIIVDLHNFVSNLSQIPDYLKLKSDPNFRRKSFPISYFWPLQSQITLLFP